MPNIIFIKQILNYFWSLQKPKNVAERNVLWSVCYFSGHLLKSAIFVIQKAAAPKNGVEFGQTSIDAISNSQDPPKFQNQSMDPP